MADIDHRPKITVEDLLRLKRAERPEAEFWNNFERELRQKQLTALLEKRSWWQQLPQLFARRAYLPVGATAILAFTIVSVKFYAPTQIARVETAPSVDATSALTPRLEATTSVASAAVSSPLVNRESIAPVPAETATVTAAVDVPSIDVETAELLPAVVARPTVESPSARSIAASLAHLTQSEPELINAVMGNRLSAPARMENVSAASTEMASVPTGNSRRSRILAQYSDRPLSPEPTAPAIVRERLSRHLGDPEINDRLSRIGLKGDQVSLGLTLRL